MPNGRDVKQYLACLIDDIDAGRSPQRRSFPSWVRSLAVPAAVGATMGLAACDDTPEPEVTKDEAREAYQDGTVDDLCAELGAAAGCDLCDLQGWNGDDVCDDFCVPADADCAAPLYGVESEANCANGLDDDGDTLIDCCDDDCAASGDCNVVCPEYGAPLSETDCDDCIDNDCDGYVDAEDPDCTAIAYGIPFEENCADGLDDDGDTLIDCCDDDCTGDESCTALCPDYGGPFPETDCDDCVDNDCDGNVDAEDPDCTAIAYGIPFEENCADGLDDDGDTLIDCCDDDCTGDESCTALCPDYGGPFPETDCDDCVDNNCNGLTDDADPDCSATPDYGVPFEANCANGLDDDGDTLIDCCDDDCAASGDCNVVCPEYGAPLSETDCDDCIDNDCDGYVDSTDDECVSILYGVPM